MDLYTPSSSVSTVDYFIRDASSTNVRLLKECYEYFVVHLKQGISNDTQLSNQLPEIQQTFMHKFIIKRMNRLQEMINAESLDLEEAEYGLKIMIQSTFDDNIVTLSRILSILTFLSIYIRKIPNITPIIYNNLISTFFVTIIPYLDLIKDEDEWILYYKRFKHQC